MFLHLLAYVVLVFSSLIIGTVIIATAEVWLSLLSWIVAFVSFFALISAMIWAFKESFYGSL